MSNIDIEIDDISIFYNEVEALKNISFKVNKNDFIGIIGPNGGGKTTLLKTILGLITPDSGSVKIFNENGIGYVPQFAEFDKSFPISVSEVILMGLMKKKSIFFKRYNKTDIKKADDLMKQLDISNLKDKQIGRLSGGQLQKVLIARAMISKPGILLLDEPTASLDVKIKNEIYKMLLEFNKTMTIIIITHDIAEVYPCVTSVMYIDKTLHYHGKDGSFRENVFGLTAGCPIEDFMIKEEALKKDFMIQEDLSDD